MDEASLVKEVELWARENGGFEEHRFFRTSGSSGEEKWVALSNRALEWSARSVIEALEISSQDVLGLALPVIHVGGYGLMLRAKISGATLIEFESCWNPEDFTHWCDVNAVSISSLVPTQVHDLVKIQASCPTSIRKIVVGGGELDEGLAGRARLLGWPVIPSYGMTETSSQVATGDGLPLLPGWDAKIVEGRLALKGGGLFTSIIRKKDGGFVAEDPKMDGWYVTNDRCDLSGEGLRILGRADRLIKVLGELIDLEGLENFWRNKLGCEVALVTRPDERRGVNLLLFHEGTEMDLMDWNSSLPGPERISDAIAVDLLPRSVLGKIDRSALSKFHAD
ncbi:MAG: AMP-binding protein [Akkermansiaceae bacterium]